LVTELHKTGLFGLSGWFGSFRSTKETKQTNQSSYPVAAYSNSGNSTFIIPNSVSPLIPLPPDPGTPLPLTPHDPCSTRSFAPNNCRRSRKENLDVTPERLLSGIAKVQPDHLVERRPASASYLPQPRKARHGI
jgi:hypothetical protein